MYTADYVAGSTGCCGDKLHMGGYSALDVQDIVMLNCTQRIMSLDLGDVVVINLHSRLGRPVSRGYCGA